MLALFSPCQNEVSKIIALRGRNCVPTTALYLALCFVNPTEKERRLVLTAMLENEKLEKPGKRDISESA